MTAYFIKENYACNLDPQGRARPFLDDRESASRYQVKVYEYARSLIRRHGLKNVLDIGCGLGVKLKRIIYPVCHDITGIDQAHAVSFCRKEYDFGRWLEDDLENPVFPVDGKFDLILSSDVLEHLVNPDCLLAYIKHFSHENSHIVLSTPERDRVHGRNHNGPPVNPTHVREWNRAELNRYIKNQGFIIDRHFLSGEMNIRPVEILKQAIRLRPLRKIQVVHCRPGKN
jgi:SAM-dependent methyltransferase